MAGLQFGIPLVISDDFESHDRTSWDHTLQIALLAEEMGFDNIWVPDELFWRSEEGSREGIGWWEGVAMAGALAAATTTIGIGTMSADVRYTFGIWELFDGIPFIAVLMGMFGIATMSQLAGEPQTTISREALRGSRINGIVIALREWRTILKSSIIGFLIGAFPGTGGSVANFVAYGEAVRSNPDETFGVGNPKGLVATESSNNAMIDGALRKCSLRNATCSCVVIRSLTRSRMLFSR